MKDRLLVMVAATVAVASLCTVASAAGLYPAADSDLAPIKWTGFIVAPYFGYETLHLKGQGADALNDPQGWRVGGELDYDYQVGNLVFGIAGDGFYTWYKGDGASGAPDLTSRLTDYGTIRGRLGYTFGRWMIFGTGGYAFGDLSVKNSGLEESKTLSGWTAGGGVEWVWNNDLTLRGELAHISLGNETFATLPAGKQDLGADLDLFKIDFITRY
ncbi:MAG: outer membrane beta-barrel protein [Hyphomicrobium sp.]|jgi:outer membrane immunogenic protein